MTISRIQAPPVSPRAPAASPGAAGSKIAHELEALVGTGLLATPLEKALRTEQHRLAGCQKGSKGDALQPKLRQQVEQRMREIDVLLRSGLMQPSMERQLESERGALTKFCKAG